MNMEVEIKDILPNPWQTRRASPEEHIKSLALDIAANGLLQNPVGRLMLDGQPASLDELSAAQLLGEIPDGCQVQLAFGHNRLAAYHWLNDSGSFFGSDNNWAFIPVDLKLLSDEQMATFAWSENEKRRELSPVERAQAIAKRIDDFGWSHEDAAENLGISRPAISNALRLLKLPEDVQDYLHYGQISERQAMALLKLFEQPDDLVEEHVFNNQAGYLVRLALDGESSEALRQLVDDKITSWKLKSQPQLISAPEPWQNRESPLPEPAPEPYPPAYQSEPYQPIRFEPTAPADEQPEPVQQPAVAQPEQETQPAAPQPSQETAVQTAADPHKPAEKTGELSIEQSTITMTVTLWPYDGNSMGRMVVLGARINEQTPIMQMLREKEINLPLQLIEMRLKLSQDYKRQS